MPAAAAHELMRRYLLQQREQGERELPVRFAPAPLAAGTVPVAAPTAVPRPAPAKPAVTLAAPVVPAASADGATALEAFRAEICGCTRCALGKLRKNFVFGEGNPSARVVFVGEAPGEEEDNQGRPFVGPAGQLLTKIIEAIKFRREDVYICNILKCRPPGNRDPEPAEVERCEPHLLRQLEIIKPAVICALGRHAAQTLLKTTAPISRLRGRAHDYHGIKLVPTFHPAALLRNPSWKRPAWEDVQLVRRIHDEEAARCPTR